MSRLFHAWCITSTLLVAFSIFQLELGPEENSVNVSPPKLLWTIFQRVLCGTLWHIRRQTKQISYCTTWNFVVYFGLFWMPLMSKVRFQCLALSRRKQTLESFIDGSAWRRLETAETDCQNPTTGILFIPPGQIVL